MSARRPTFNGRPMPVRYCSGGCCRDLDALELDELASGGCCLACHERMDEERNDERERVAESVLRAKEDSGEVRS